ncbi:Oidioi.mRNA.OKI2018_I69.chr1.g1187.t1.cds [Oikopleura dioica]|uniref:Oidioi.mRNA.OKI2018_I69.chr1.g1187.t1.cds n=1 Tax=Oikopleura dioica TaxID=34765 RepID=A0ABN7SU88_OIKDI|nr:Oidioi.mRNA.OKI2018_I69.chr1.g1187.t1.cds [Oikopleura dioica]
MAIDQNRRESIISQAYARAVRSRSISVPVQSERFLVVEFSERFILLMVISTLFLLAGMMALGLSRSSEQNCTYEICHIFQSKGTQLMWILVSSSFAMSCLAVYVIVKEAKIVPKNGEEIESKEGDDLL